jgi:hypothetical protein
MNGVWLEGSEYVLVIPASSTIFVAMSTLLYGDKKSGHMVPNHLQKTTIRG